MDKFNFPYSFTSHKLRHASVIRLHNNGYNVKAIADNHGHSIIMTTGTYANSASQKTKYDNQRESFVNHKSYKDLENEVKFLKEENELLIKENMQLKKNLNSYLR